MTGDFTRTTFRAASRYTKVRAQQGRAVLDAELNEQADIAAHRGRTTATDVIGPSGVPWHDPAAFRNFQIAVGANGRDLRIAPGRIYVGGLLCENDADDLTYLTQPDLPGAALPAAAGAYAVYLDVWERHIAAAEQPAGAFPPMREAALGGADTASRVRVVWQVKLAPVQSQTCGAFQPPAAPTGRLRAREIQGAAAATDCMVPASGGYRRLENQLYRVEIHAVAAATTTYKWSRDNASLSSRARSSDQNAATIVVEDAGRDDVIGFASAKYVELTDEGRVLNGQSGVLLEVDTVTGTSIRVKNPASVSLALGSNAIVRRWDGVGEITANSPVELEDGVEIEFDAGTFAVGDQWSFAARTLTGKVEWPRTATGDPIFETRHGTFHRYAPLAVVSFAQAAFVPTVQDCRALFPPLTAITARDVSYDPAQCSNLQGVETVQEALDRLCQASGADEPGIHVKGVFLGTGDDLLNDTLIAPASLARGIRIDCNERLFEGSVVNKHGLPNPVCGLTVEVPWPLRGEERQFWGVEGNGIVGFQPIALAGEVVVSENAIRWTPLGPTQNWLANRLLQMVTEMTGDQTPRVLARLHLTGNFIWGPAEEPRLYLDGDGFGVPGRDHVDVRLPSGDRRRGGSFATWFWLARAARRVPGVGFFTARASRFFAAQAGAASFGAQAVQLGLDRSSTELRSVLPEGYEVDASQRFNATEAAAAARRTGVARVVGIISERLARPGQLLVQQLTRSLRIEVAQEIMPDAQVLERVRAGMAAGAPPDFVFADEALGARLQTLEYSSEFIRI